MSPTKVRPRKFPREMHLSSLPNPETVILVDDISATAYVRSMPKSYLQSCKNHASSYNSSNSVSPPNDHSHSTKSCHVNIRNEMDIDALPRSTCTRSLITSFNKTCSDQRYTLNNKNKFLIHNCNYAQNNNHGSTWKRHLNLSERYNNLLNTRSITSDYGDETVRSTSSRQSNILWRNHTWPVVLILLTSLLCTTCSADPNQCAVGLTTPGSKYTPETWPQGDIVLEYGQSLRIFCMLNKTFIDTIFPGKNASDLVFFRNKKEMQPEYITIVNETTISMYVEKPPPAEDMYYCKLRLNNGYNKQYEAVCLNKVVIGFKPQEPQNFSCISRNWEDMMCSWDPVQNYVTTRFTLVFKLPGRAGGRKLYPCPKETQKTLQPNTCLWDTSTNPIYRQPYEYYTFILNVENVLGNISVFYKFHHFAHVIPAKPANLSVINKTSDSALLHWSVPFPMQNFPPGLHHRVTYQNQWDFQKTWQVINITNDVRVHKRYFNLTGLEYANAVYDVRVFMKSALAIGEDKWSQFSDITFRTPPRLPGLPPRTDIGSFEIADNNGNRDVYLYWQAIPSYLENGDSFKYEVAHVEENSRKLSLSPNEITKTYAKFKGISFNSFRFEIVTTNVIGSNKKRAKIYVPSRLEIPREPISFTKIAFENGLYELSWKPPVASAEIVNYTIFWCDNERDRPYQCTGYLDWVHVPRNTSIYNMTVPDPKKVYQFAISANTERASSGMVWASCTVIHNKVVGKMKSVWINRIGSDFIEVGWKLDCSDRIGIVEGFNIYYCPIMSPYNLNCKGPKMNTTIKADPHSIHGIVNGLKPYTTYMLAVAVLTKSGEGLHSDPLYNTTLEAAPATSPQEVKVTNITNSTMFVTWERPDAMNGVLRYYEIYFNNHSLKVEEADRIELKDLSAHTNYSVRVAACTVSCSVKSPSIYKVTDIGIPGKINAVPTVRFMNSSQVTVHWNKPENSAGYLDYYQIESSDGEIQNSTKNETQLPIPDCKTVGREKLYKFRVRAINIASDNMHLEGPWSEYGEGSCYSDGLSFIVWIIILVIGSLSGVTCLLCLAYVSKRLWLKCKAMQDVEVKLPPGLAPNMKLLQKVGEQHTRQLSADSSGCSSGQESVTSSLTSDSNVTTDSGAEVDPVPVSPNKLLESPPWELSSLRQRNVGTTKPAATTDSARWDLYVKVTKPDEPILTDTLSLARSPSNLTDSAGYTTSQQTWSSTGYISMPSSEELSSNPSPVPKENLNVGGYSVVGVVPKSTRSKSDDNTDLTESMISNLISVKTEAKSSNPYVTLASLDQQPKDRMVIDSLGDLDDFTFIEPISKPNLDNLAPFSISDKISKPYVQTGLMDSLKQPFLPSTLMDSTKSNTTKVTFAPTSPLTTESSNKSLVSTFPSSTMLTQSSTDTLSKPYVAVTTPVLDAVNKAPYISTTVLDGSPNSYVPVSTASDIATNKPYVLATSVFQMLQQQREKSDTPIPDIDDDDDDDNDIDIEEVLPSTYPFCWQQGHVEQGTTLESEKSVPTGKKSPGYVTIVDNSKLEQQSSQQVSSPYVQHQRFEKPLPQQSTGQSDEQYSKMTIVPTTIQ